MSTTCCAGEKEGPLWMSYSDNLWKLRDLGWSKCDLKDSWEKMAPVFYKVVPYGVT